MNGVNLEAVTEDKKIAGLLEGQFYELTVISSSTLTNIISTCNNCTVVRHTATVVKTVQQLTLNVNKNVILSYKEGERGGSGSGNSSGMTPRDDGIVLMPQLFKQNLPSSDASPFFTVVRQQNDYSLELVLFLFTKTVPSWYYPVSGIGLYLVSVCIWYQFVSGVSLYLVSVCRN